MRVRQIMTENPCVCARDTSIQEVARMMERYDCGAIPVVDDRNGQSPVGIITDRDIAIRIVARGDDPTERRASDAMTRDLITASPDDSVEDLAQKMERQQIRRVVVVENGHCVGIVAQADIARKTDHELTAEVVEEVSR